MGHVMPDILPSNVFYTHVATEYAWGGAQRVSRRSVTWPAFGAVDGRLPNTSPPPPTTN